jgi:hypothetical protein
MYVGVPLGIALGIALAIIALLTMKNRKLKQANGQQYPYSGVVTDEAKETSYVQATELGTRPGELSDGRENAVELPNGAK